MSTRICIKYTEHTDTHACTHIQHASTNGFAYDAKSTSTLGMSDTYFTLKLGHSSVYYPQIKKQIYLFWERMYTSNSRVLHKDDPLYGGAGARNAFNLNRRRSMWKLCLGRSFLVFSARHVIMMISSPPTHISSRKKTIHTPSHTPQPLLIYYRFPN